MKRAIIIVLLLSFATTTSFSQSLEKGNQCINAGIGLGNGYHAAGAAYGFGIGFNASYEYAIVEVRMGSQLTGVVGVGGFAGISLASRTYGSIDGKSHYTNWMIAARGTYHFIFHDKFDPYAALSLGYWGYSWKWKGNGQISDPTGTYGGFGPGFVAGARYFFTPNIAIYAEIGYLLNILNFGVTFKIE